MPGNDRCVQAGLVGYFPLQCAIRTSARCWCPLAKPTTTPVPRSPMLNNAGIESLPVTPRYDRIYLRLSRVVYSPPGKQSQLLKRLRFNQ